ncbi:uncharacterized protein [Blastocystis hominis]|uniref:Uncharacterized protein n=1 Tax=Blastocystis hominis TaxID=12968 RepID=D8M6B0_BLAHO|nr:uncharacterized protein [Blastocystis hominis]CBK23663.2 unnamed protein product [Blastocystis hominis]|eukprot:XP_012897711.1 uncharacterized protein [Blastocystis hominis]
MGCDVLPNCFVLEDYSRQIGIDLVNQELHGYLNPYTYEINRTRLLLLATLTARRLLPRLRRSKTRSNRPASRFQRGRLPDHRQRARAFRADRLASPRALLRVFAARALLSVLSRIHLRDFDLHGDAGLRDRRGAAARLAVAAERSVQQRENREDSGRGGLASAEAAARFRDLLRQFVLDPRSCARALAPRYVLHRRARALHRTLAPAAQPTLRLEVGSGFFWNSRIRPFAKWMVQDVCEAVHFLPFVCDCMKKQLVENSPPSLNLIHDVLARGNESCLKSFEKPIYSFEYGKWLIPKWLGLLFNKTQKMLFLSLTYWRDIQARLLDESCEFVLPLDCFVRIVFNAPAVPWSRVLRARSPAVQASAEVLKELVKRVLEIKDGKMAVYAMIVEESVRRSMHCEVTTCQWNLSDSFRVDQVDLGRRSEEIVHENELFACDSQEGLLQRLLNHGTFKLVHSNLSNDEGYLYYNPSSLPYNATTPLRNSIPYLPIEVDAKGVRISNVIPAKYVNRHIREYVERVNASRTPQDVEEMQQIKSSLQLPTIAKNLMMLGSVLEDDMISLSSDDETVLDDELKQIAVDLASEEYQPHYPPRTLREIYSLPHKNRGDLKDGLSMSVKELNEVLGVVQSSELTQDDLDALLTESSTAEMNDMEFLDAIGWTSKADDLEKVFAVDDCYQVVAEERAQERAQETTLESYAKLMESRGGGEKGEMEMNGFGQGNGGRGGKGGRQGRRYGPRGSNSGGGGSSNSNGNSNNGGNSGSGSGNRNMNMNPRG